ncbi:MAG: hypothetical protein ACK551_00360 [Vampirovibrionales bacterium]
MIPTTARYAPNSPQTPARQTVPAAQRQGFTIQEWNLMNGRLIKTARVLDLPKDPFFSDINLQPFSDQLHELWWRGKLYIHCLEQKGFLTKSLEEQEAIIDAFHKEHQITLSTLAKKEIDTALLKLKQSNPNGLSQPENPEWWQKFVTSVQKEIDKLTQK